MKHMRKKTKYSTIIALAIIAVLAITCVNFFNFAVEKVNAQTKQPIIVIDAGHGGFDPGATANNLLEKDINLQIALVLADIFRVNGYEVVLTRECDKSLETQGSTVAARKKSDMNARLDAAMSNPNCVFLSIHQNSYSGASGSQVFYNKSNEQGQILAEFIQNSIVQALQPESNRVHKASGNEYFLLKKIPSPAVLVECGFITNSKEVKKLCDPDYQKQLSVCIYNGVCQYLSSSKNEL